MKHAFKLAALAVFGTVTLASPSLAALTVGTKAPDFTAPAYLAGQPLTCNRATNPAVTAGSRHPAGPRLRRPTVPAAGSTH